MKFWPWTVLDRAAAARAEAEALRDAAKGHATKAGALWDEANQSLHALDGMLAAADYRIPHDRGESWDDYKAKLERILHEGRQAPVTLAILDRLDSKTREGYRLWLIEEAPGKAEVLRHRCAALADFRAELVAACYSLDAKARRAEMLRQGQEHRRIYLDQQRDAPPASIRS